MPTAFENLQDMIEAVRRESDAGGYERALREMGAFVQAKLGVAGSPARPTPDESLAAISAHAAVNATLFTNGQGGPSNPPGRSPRGHNRHIVISILDKHNNRPLSATDIQRLATSEGAKIAYSSTRHALDQLSDEGRAVEARPGYWKLKDVSAPKTEVTEADLLS
jgi:hypothetical protein